jgi:branched-subunit amino acid aminotransferase/4-amino-4-deoxychorismate lyase
MTRPLGDEVQLFAVSGAELHRLPLPTGGGTVHDVLAAAPAGVYSGLRTFGGDRFLRLDAHLDRVEANLAALGWKVAFDRAGFRRALHRAVTAYPLPDARVRFDVLREPARELGASSNVLLALSPFEPVPERFLREGVAVELTGDLRRERPLIKTTDFVERRKPYPVGDIDCYEHVMLDATGRLLECTSANFFGVSDGTLLTAGEGVLEGITRSIFLELARAAEIPVRLEAVTVAEIGGLDEAFLTSSSRGLVPIVRIDGQRIGAGRPGPVGRRLLADYLELAEREARTAV